MNLVSYLENKIWQNHRKKVNAKNRARLTEKAKTATILSMNCTGGIISHDLGLQFLSPTVNLFMRADAFIKFCENLEYYLSIDEFKPCTDKNIIGERTYPIGYLDDLLVFFVHYNSLEQAQQKWNERKKRVNFDNIVILNADREGCTDEIKDRFEKLPYRKVLFTHLPDETHKSCYYISGYEDEPCVGIVTAPRGIKGYRPVDEFDYVGLLNGEFVNE